jgi:hypothetical protein
MASSITSKSSDTDAAAVPAVPANTVCAEEAFDTAVVGIKALSPAPSQQHQLRLYGLFKQTKKVQMRIVERFIQHVFVKS